MDKSSPTGLPVDESLSDIGLDHRYHPMMVYMNTSAKTKTNNERLREIVEASGLTQPVALTVFNRGLGARPYSESTWKAFLSNPETTRFRPLSDEMLAHAEKQFGKLQPKS